MFFKQRFQTALKYMTHCKTSKLGCIKFYNILLHSLIIQLNSTHSISNTFQSVFNAFLWCSLKSRFSQKSKLEYKFEFYKNLNFTKIHLSKPFFIYKAYSMYILVHNIHERFFIGLINFNIKLSSFLAQKYVKFYFSAYF